MEVDGLQFSVGRFPSRLCQNSQAVFGRCFAQVLDSICLPPRSPRSLLPVMIFFFHLSPVLLSSFPQLWAVISFYFSKYPQLNRLSIFFHSFCFFPLFFPRVPTSRLFSTVHFQSFTLQRPASSLLSSSTYPPFPSSFPPPPSISIPNPAPSPSLSSPLPLQNPGICCFDLCQFF